MKNNPHYTELIVEARNKQIKLYMKHYVEIRKVFKEASEELSTIASKAGKKTLTSRFALDYKKEIDKALKEVNKLLYVSNKAAIKKAAKYANQIQLDFFSLIDGYGLDIDETFKKVFSNVPGSALKEILKGKMYHDNRGLSQRIWIDSKLMDKDMGVILEKAIATKKSAFEFAKDIEKYVDPEAKKPWDWGKVYPNTRRQIDYNAQRLARTSINHAFFLANVRSSLRNPFVECMHWELSSEHYERQVKRWGEDICDINAQSDWYDLGAGNYPADKIPLPHPQCLCKQYPVIVKSLDEVGAELKAWLDGEENPRLDHWYNTYGKEYAA